MQSAKDSFYMALCDRLKNVNPERTVVIEGEVRPAIVMMENEAANGAQPPETFVLEWGAVQPVAAGRSGDGLMAIDLTVRYRTQGSRQGESDRGRALTTMDRELLAICSPPQTAKLDYAQATPAALGSKVFWRPVCLSAATQTAGMLGRGASTTIYFYPESEA